MSIIYRKFIGSTKKNLENAIKFDTLDDLKVYLCKVYKEKGFELRPEEIIPGDIICNDVTTGWHDSRYIEVVPYEQVQDKIGYKNTFHFSCNVGHPIGVFATRWDDKSSEV